MLQPTETKWDMCIVLNLRLYGVSGWRSSFTWISKCHKGQSHKNEWTTDGDTSVCDKPNCRPSPSRIKPNCRPFPSRIKPNCRPFPSRIKMNCRPFPSRIKQRQCNETHVFSVRKKRGNQCNIIGQVLITMFWLKLCRVQSAVLPTSSYEKMSPKTMSSYEKMSPHTTSSYEKMSPQTMSSYEKMSPQTMSSYENMSPQTVIPHLQRTHHRHNYLIHWHQRHTRTHSAIF
ncbi:hypothetical protein Btru_037876 [Bulinus truncatus]|nr:hypothetical protein Btru_037876 [Bulinus truncatus]